MTMAFSCATSGSMITSTMRGPEASFKRKDAVYGQNCMLDQIACIQRLLLEEMPHIS